MQEKLAVNTKSKWIIYCFLALLTSAFCNCSQKNISYNIPADIPPENKRVLLGILEKGKLLYKKNCSACHGIFTKGKEEIPNFSKEQLDNYTSRAVLEDSKNHGAAQSLTQEELKSVLIFLNLVKRNPKTSVP